MDNDIIEFTVHPTGPCAPAVVTIATPVGQCVMK
jgi:hypothetical protein